MTKKNIQQRLQQMADVWVNCDKQLLHECYNINFLGEYYGKKVDYQDLTDRLTYLEEHQTHRKFTFEEIIIDDNRAAIRFIWQAIDKKDGELNLPVAAFFVFDEKLQATQGWAFANHKVDY
jgi:hypothetical protein